MFEVFESEASRRKKLHLKNLAYLAKLDGHVSDEELSFLFKVGLRNGIYQGDIRKWLSSESPSKVAVPNGDTERFEIIFDLVEMIVADRVIEESEIDYAIDFCIKLGFRPAISGILVRKIASDLIEGKTKQHVQDKVKDFLEIKTTPN